MIDVGEPIALTGQGRVFTTEAVWEQVSRRHALLATRTAELTGLDRLGIPVVAVTRAFVRAGQNSTVQGCAADVKAATVAALMECVEREAAARAQPLRTATEPELAAAGLALVPLATLGGRQTSAPIQWVEGRRLNDGAAFLLPAAEVLFPYFPPDGMVLPLRPSTSGLAAGGTRAEALLHALFEVVERNAVSSPKALALQVDLAVLDGEEEQLMERFRKADIAVLAVAFPEAAVPTYKVFSIDRATPGGHLAVSGQGTHLDPRQALRRALFEVVQARAVAISGSREDLERHRGHWEADGAVVESRFALLSALVARNGTIAPPRPRPMDGTVVRALEEVRTLLASRGYRHIYWTDLTDARLGIPVVHACVPGLADLRVDSAREGT
jgi:ribosomal protein S12 methylthiotransferase accessory factor